jgi:hypothetical protein
MRHAIGFQILVPHATERPGDDDVDEQQPPPHHAREDVPDEKSYYRLAAQRATIEAQYWGALVRGNQRAADEANKQYQEIDRRLSKVVPHPECDEEPDEDEEAE